MLQCTVVRLLMHGSVSLPHKLSPSCVPADVDRADVGGRAQDGAAEGDAGPGDSAHHDGPHHASGARGLCADALITLRSHVLCCRSASASCMLRLHLSHFTRRKTQYSLQPRYEARPAVAHS